MNETEKQMKKDYEQMLAITILFVVMTLIWIIGMVMHFCLGNMERGLLGFIGLFGFLMPLFICIRITRKQKSKFKE